MTPVASLYVPAVQFRHVAADKYCPALQLVAALAIGRASKARKHALAAIPLTPDASAACFYKCGYAVCNEMHPLAKAAKAAARCSCCRALQQLKHAEAAAAAEAR